MLRFDNISLSYGDTKALASINLQIPANKITILIGPSGCGKSTLLRLIAGLVNSDQGSISFEGSKINSDTITRLRHRMGYVIQGGGLFPHLSVRDNVTVMASHLKWAANKIESRLQELTELVQISPDLYRRYPAELSGGQRQRISLMRALMLDPDLLLLDEPLGALDPIIRFDLQRELKQIFKRLSKTVILVTHDLAEAAYFADQIVLLRNGEIIQQGSMQDLAKNPAQDFVEQFINAQRIPLAMLDQVLS